MFFAIMMILTAGQSSASAKAGDFDYDAIDAGVTRVQTGGRWKDGARSGRYRVVVKTRCSREHCYDGLFVEWLQDIWPEEDAPTTKVVAAKRIEEVGGLTTVSQLRFVGSGTRPRLEVEHKSGDDEKWTICVTLDTPGRYKGSDGRCR
jgi:hypothetical protein